jgi:hypothetical protein
MFGLLGTLVLASAVRELLSGARVHPASLWGGLLILAAFPIRMAIGSTVAWHQFAAWLVR